MAQFKSGQSGNKAGRPPGAKDKMNAQLTDMIWKFIKGHWEELDAAWEKMKPGEQARLVSDLIKHIKPPPFDPSRLSVEQLEEVYDYFKNRNDEEK